MYRVLNNLERKIFQLPFSNLCNTQVITGSSIFSKFNFISNLNRVFYYNDWHLIFEKSIFIFSGGSMVRSISKSFIQTGDISDIDLYAFGVTEDTFQNEINKFIMFFKSKGYIIFEDKVNLLLNNIYVKFNGSESKFLSKGSKNYNLHVIKSESGWLQFQFILREDCNSLFDVLHGFDIDCCQIGFNGVDCFCTPACMQSLNTGSFISYSVTRDSVSRVISRIFKYVSRGYTFLFPKDYTFGLIN